MKTQIILLAVLASTFGAQAQGLILFANTIPPTRISTNSIFGGAATGRTAAGANLYDYALFYSTTATTVAGTTNAQMPGLNGLGTYAFEDSNWTLAAYGTNTLSIPGRFASTSQNADGSTTINGLAGGTTAQFVVLGWSANLGSTVAELESNFEMIWCGYAWIGESAVSEPIQLGDGEIIPTPRLFGLISPTIQGFTLGVGGVPEPSTLVLAGAGLAGLFSFRHRWRV